MKRNLFKRHRLPRNIVLMAVRWYCRYPLSCRGVRDLLGERGVHADVSMIKRSAVKFGLEIAKRSHKH